MHKSILEMVTEIVAGQSSQRILSVEDIDKLIKQTYRSLKAIETLEIGGEGLAEKQEMDDLPSSYSSVKQGESDGLSAGPRMDPRDSIRQDSIVCLVCGAEMKQLTFKHLASHGVTGEEYRQRFKLPKNQPLVATSVSERRKALAQERNVGERLKQAREAKRVAPSDKTTVEGSEGERT